MGEDVEVRFEDAGNAEELRSVEVESPPEPPAPKLSDLAIFLKRTRALVPVAVVGLFLLAIVAGLYFGKPFVMPIVIATMISFLLTPLVRALTRFHVPQLLAAILVMG